MGKWLAKRKAIKRIRYKVFQGEDINVDSICQLCGVDAAIAHKICAKYVQKGRLQKLYNTPSIDYWPIGDYGRYIRFPHPDGAKNPFLTDDGHLGPGLVPPKFKEAILSRAKAWPDPPPTKRPVNCWSIDANKD